MNDLELAQKEDQIVAEELRKRGIHVDSTQDLMHTKEPYPQAIPVLLEMLPRMQGYAMKEVIVRSLGVREAKGYAEPLLISLFESSLSDNCPDAESLRWAIANTLEILGGGKGTSESMLRFLADPRSGRSRGMLSVAAAKTKNRDAIPVLLKMLESDDFTGFVAEGLGILRAEEAIPKLRMIVKEHSKPWVRRQAKTALKRLGITD